MSKVHPEKLLHAIYFDFLLSFADKEILELIHFNFITLQQQKMNISRRFFLSFLSLEMMEWMNGWLVASRSTMTFKSGNWKPEELKLFCWKNNENCGLGKSNFSWLWLVIGSKKRRNRVEKKIDDKWSEHSLFAFLPLTLNLCHKILISSELFALRPPSINFHFFSLRLEWVLCVCFGRKTRLWEACLSVCLYVCMYACVCVSVWLYAWMYVCMYVW